MGRSGFSYTRASSRGLLEGEVVRGVNSKVDRRLGRGGGMRGRGSCGTRLPPALRVSALRGSSRLCGGGVSAAISLRCRVVPLAAEKLQVVYGDFCTGVLHSLLVCPGAGAEPSFYIELGAFADEPLSYVCGLPPGNYAVPFGVLAGLSCGLCIFLWLPGGMWLLWCFHRGNVLQGLFQRYRSALLCSVTYRFSFNNFK